MPDVAIIPSGGKDRWGDDLPPGEPILVEDVITYPRRSDETNVNSVITGITAIFPADTSVPESIDAVVVGIHIVDRAWVPGTGKRYEVIGDAGVWSNLDGDVKGIEVALEKVSG